jgi:predicted pyridoxine 5'-phosphate oxidase superfamily flavin-nucleotide-binding protein
MSRSIFHRGERAVQERAQERHLADQVSVVVSDTVISGARAFIGRQFMVVLASIDKDAAVWSSVLFGRPGFAHTDNGESVSVNVAVADRDLTDPFWRNIETNTSIGMLFIDLGSRRRYRVNGSLIRMDAAAIEVAVREAYPNCPKYIQRRQLRKFQSTGVPGKPTEGVVINAELASILRQADTLFVASHHPEYGADVSHRGGAPGYIQILDDHTLRIPDYPGNCLYNTFGNFEVDARAGLCVPQFPTSRLLQLSGEASLRWDLPDPEGHTGGTGRFWDFKITHWILRNIPQLLEWDPPEASPFNLPVAGSAAV